MRAPGARAATTSLAPLPPRSAKTSFGLVSTKGFVASMSTRPFQAGRVFNADSTFRQGTASKDRKSTRLNSSHGYISYAVFFLKKKKENRTSRLARTSHPNLLLTTQY